MNKLVNYLNEFANIADDWYGKQEWFEDRYRFFIEFYKKENLGKAEWEDIQKLGDNIHSFQSLAIAKGNALGKSNLLIEEYRRNFEYLVRGEDPIEKRIINLFRSNCYKIIK